MYNVSPVIVTPQALANNIFAANFHSMAVMPQVNANVLAESLFGVLNRDCDVARLISVHTGVIAPTLFANSSIAVEEDAYLRRVNEALVNSFRACLSAADVQGNTGLVGRIDEAALDGYVRSVRQLLMYDGQATFQRPTYWSGAAAVIRFKSVAGARKKDFSGINFRDIPEVLIRAAQAANPEIFKGANLSNSDMRGIVLIAADLEGVDLSGADLRGADLIRTNMAGANLSGARLNRARLNSARLVRANLSGAELRRAILLRADLDSAILVDAKLGGADLTSAILSHADLSGANLFMATLRSANMEKADLPGANLVRANISGADLGGADLRGVNLREAYMYGADLSGADLGSADLGGADLGGAILSDAAFEGTRGRRISGLPRWRRVQAAWNHLRHTLSQD